MLKEAPLMIKPCLPNLRHISVGGESGLEARTAADAAY
jgi:hypothetical protein